MKTILAIVALIALATPASAQGGYGGPPMWDRNYGNPEYRRPRYIPPWRVQRCVYSGQCDNPYGRGGGYRMPPPPPPPPGYW